MAIKKSDIFRNASADFLSDMLPDDSLTMSEADLLVFCEENSWEPLEDKNPEWVLGCIINATDSWVQFLMDNGIEVIEDMI